MAADDLTARRLREMLYYCPESGDFIWLHNRRGCAKAGDTAGYKGPNGYVRIKLDGGAYLAHRLAWLYMHGAWPSGCIDHINGNRADNRAVNLRDVSSRVNSQNERSARRRRAGGSLIGAHWHSRWKRWRSSINVNGKLLHLGTFDTEQQAHEAYVKAKRAMHVGCTI